MNLHLTGAGALSGDMFIAAILDAFPQFEDRVLEAIEALDTFYPVCCSLEAHGALAAAGKRFDIQPFDRYFGSIPYAFASERPSWSTLHEWIDGLDVDECTWTHAHGILRAAARSESPRQQLPRPPVVFMAQVLGAAALVDALRPARWTSSLPAGIQGDAIVHAILDYLRAEEAWDRQIQRSPLRGGVGFGADTHSVLRLAVFNDSARTAIPA